MTDMMGEPGQHAVRPARWLVYSNHARDRAYERSLPILDRLPADAKLADRDSDASIYAIPDDRGDCFLVVATDGTVVTAFRKDAATWERRINARPRRRVEVHCGALAMRSCGECHPA